jgi:hypothetical protein
LLFRTCCKPRKIGERADVRRYGDCEAGQRSGGQPDRFFLSPKHERTKRFLALVE